MTAKWYMVWSDGANESSIFRGSLVPEKVFSLQPNIYDGAQRSADAEGDDVPSSALSSVTGLAAIDFDTNSITYSYQYGGIGHTGFQVEVNYSEGAGWIATLPDGGALGPNDRRFILGGLPGNTLVGVRIRPVAGAVLGPLSLSPPEAWETTDYVINPGTELFSYMLGAEAGAVGYTFIGLASDRWTEGSDTLVQDTEIYEESRAWAMTRSAAVQGDGSGSPDGVVAWGGKKEFSPTEQGDTLHVQFSIYLPVGFDWTAFPYLNVARVTTVLSGAVSYGEFEALSIDGGLGGYGNENGTLICDNVSAPGVQTPATGLMTTGSWETFEFEIVADSVAEDSGGAGRFRLWRRQNGELELILEDTARATLPAADASLTAVTLFGHWGDGCIHDPETHPDGEGVYPATEQTCYADRVFIETDITNLNRVDDSGNFIIGLPGGNLTTPTGFAISNVTSSSADITWAYGGTGHTGFEIQRMIDGVDFQFSTAKVAGPSDRFWRDTGLPDETLVTYRMRASDEV